MRLVKAFFTLVIGLSLVSVAAPTYAQEEVVEQRKDLMKSNRRTTRALEKAVKEKEYAAIQEGAKTILANAEKIASLFPDGSMSEDSRATNAVWNDPDGFKDHIGWLKDSANALEKAAVAKDDDLVGLEYKAVTAACSQCHRSYRKRSRRAKKK